MTDPEPVGPSANRVGIGPLLAIPAALAVVTVPIIAVLAGRSARTDVRPLDGPTATGPRWGRSLVLLVEATRPDGPTLCSMTLEAAVSDTADTVTVDDVPVGVVIRDPFRGNEVDALRPFAGCPDVRAP